MESGDDFGKIANILQMESISYKELQKMAKDRSLPANMRRKMLMAAIIAQNAGDLKRVENIVQLHQMSRKRNRAQNLSTSKKKRKSSTKTKNRDESVVDSTSQEVGDISHYANYSDTNMYNISHNYSGRSNPTDMSGDISHNASQNNQLDYKSPSTSSSLFNDVSKLLSQNPPQYYQQADVTSKSYTHYNCGDAYCHNRQSQLMPYGIDADYCTSTGNHHQLPNFARSSSVSVMQSNLITNSNNYNMNMCSLSQSSYFRKDNNNMPALETDYLSSYLPNIPQLTGGTADNGSTSNFVPIAWSQDADMLRNRPRFDNHPDEGTQNLNDNVNNLFDLNKTDSHRSNTNFYSGYGNCNEASYSIRPNNEYVNASYDYFYSRPSGSQYISTEATNSSNSAYPNQTTTYPQNDNAMRTGFGLSNLSNYSVESLVAPLATPLPSISTIFHGTNHDYGDNDHQKMDTFQTPYTSFNYGTFPDTTSTPFNSEHHHHNVAFMDCGLNVNSRHNNDPGCVDLVTPNPSPVGNVVNDSILRSRLHVDPLYDLEVMPIEKGEESTTEDLRNSIEKDTTGNERTNISLLKVEENQLSISPAGCSVVLQKSVQGSQLNVDLSNVLAKTTPAKLEKNGDSDSTTSVRQFIYESETLHRSKIICSFLKEDSLKGENVRKLINMFGYAGQAKKKCVGLQPVTLIDASQGESKRKSTTYTVIPAVRNRACINNVRGCTVVSQAEIVQRHEKRCFFKPVPCPSNKCTWYNATKMLNQHILQDHEDELENRNQYLYSLDRKKSDDKTYHTYYQVHKKTIYVIEVYVEDNKCNVSIQHIPEIDAIFRLEKPPNVTLQMCAFCNKSRMKSWTGPTRPYYESEQKQVDLMINVRNTEFIGLHVAIG